MRTAASIFCALFFMVTQVRAQEVQSWNEVDFEASWRKVDLTLPFLARIDTGLPNPQLAATGITADVSLPWNLTLTGGYLFADLPQRSIKVHVPLLAISKSFRVRRATVVDRNRFEKLIDFGSSPVRYRNRLLLDLPFGKHDQAHLFADDEIFLDLPASARNQNRFQVGGGTRLNRRLLVDLYYLQRSLPGPTPTTHVVGATVKVMLTQKKK